MRVAICRRYRKGMRVWPLVAVIVGVPLFAGVPLLAGAASAPRLPRGFAGERFAPVVRMAGLPVPVWRAVEGYLHWRGDLTDLGDQPAPRATTMDTDFGEVAVHSCVPVLRTNHPDRVFAVAGLGARFDFVIYRHSPAGRDVRDHDHLLVFNRLASGDRTLAFTCVGKLPRSVAAVAATVAAGRCKETPGLFETN